MLQHTLTPFDCSHILGSGGRGLALFANRELGTKAKEMPCSKERREDRAVRVFERDNKRGGGVGSVE
jgi:hypothetical protein